MQISFTAMTGFKNQASKMKQKKFFLKSKPQV
jgi:hypothetical protein